MSPHLNRPRTTHTRSLICAFEQGHCASYRVPKTRPVLKHECDCERGESGCGVLA